jgi:AAA domain
VIAFARGGIRRAPACRRWVGISLGLLLATGSGAQPAAEGDPATPPASASAAPADPTPSQPQPRILDALTQMLHGTLPDSVTVSSLFATRLDQAAEVEARVEALKSEVQSIDTSLAAAHERLDALSSEGQAASPEPSPIPAPPPGAPAATAPAPGPEPTPGTPAASERQEAERVAREEGVRRAAEEATRASAAAAAERARRSGEREAQIAAASTEIEGLEMRRALAVARLTYLTRLAGRMQEMPEAARRILPGIAEPRVALRRHTAQLSALADALDRLASRVQDLSLRLGSGALVGFRTEAREVADGLIAASSALQARAATARTAAGEELALAEQLETDARGLRREFFVTMLAPDRGDRMDALFMQHLERQRRLQRGDQRSADTGGERALQQLAEVAEQIAAHPEQIGTVADAAAVEESVNDLIGRVDTAIEASRAAQDAWRLAFENEVVTVLSSQISPAARREAYTFSRTLLRDVRAEAALAAERLRATWDRVRGDAPDLRTVLVSERGLDWLLRLLGVLGVFGLWWLVRRYNGRMVTAAVRAFVRVARGRSGIRVGTVVRWSGLFQSVLPVLFAYPALLAVSALLGGEELAGHLVRAIGVPFFWYVLGRQVLLGSTRRITTGRPALIEVPPRDLERLRRTYARLGLIVAIAAVIHELALLVIGEGVTVLLVDGLALLWVGVWATWEAFEWRPSLARLWKQGANAAGSAREERVAAWMERSRWGFVLSPFVVLRLLAAWLAHGIVALSRRTDLAELLAARRLRRAAKSEETPARKVEEIPPEYLREFPLRPILGEDDALLLPREAVVSDIVGQLGRWRESRSEGSIALIGEKGSGKTTLAALVSRKVGDLTVVQHTLRGKPADETELFRALSPVLPVNGASDFREWIDGLCAGPERVMLLDEAHNLFLRVVGGYRAYDALVELVNATSSRVFWVLIFNSFTWRFLNESRSRQHYFRRLLYMPSWSADEIRDLVRRRNQQTGFSVQFDEMLLAGDRGSNGRLEVVEGADGYFRLLRETSGGNPRIATRLWLSSLSVIGEKRLRVSTFREPSSAALDGLSDELLFALAAISQHENLSAAELCRVLNVSHGLARFAIQFLSEAELVVQKDGSADRFTLSAGYYRQVLRALRQKHLLFE